MPKKIKTFAERAKKFQEDLIKLSAKHGLVIVPSIQITEAKKEE